MNDWIWGLVGLISGPLIIWLGSFINKKATAQFLARLLSKFLKNPSTRNKVENYYGTLLIELGIDLITIEPDDKDISTKILQIKQLNEELKKYIKKEG